MWRYYLEGKEGFSRLNLIHSSSISVLSIFYLNGVFSSVLHNGNGNERR